MASTNQAVLDSFKYIEQDGEMYVYQNRNTGDRVRLSYKLPDPYTDRYLVYY
ncbi:AgseGVORF125-like protein [Hyphantria cunea granulovirus]|uniref:AgseGVORF125-like protein n=1 Tax=Hyphantria cunea granulovirus TaxID=307448 RepID=A0AAF1D2B9_9BBAC|nr:AgseGVORF125-like protein [Hyphantria cunea granulovirus]QBQ01677.1 AgseGVORF125-like protein [Hyphantria cunea granulovirus]